MRQKIEMNVNIKIKVNKTGFFYINIKCANKKIIDNFSWLWIFSATRIFSKIKTNLWPHLTCIKQVFFINNYDLNETNLFFKILFKTYSLKKSNCRVFHYLKQFLRDEALIPDAFCSCFKTYLNFKISLDLIVNVDSIRIS